MDVRTQIRRAARYFAQQEALVHGHRRLTFSEAWLRGVKLANALAECGLQPGDRIATLEKNNPRLSLDELRRRLSLDD